MTTLALTSGTVSVRVDRLVKAGIVSREQDPADGRGSGSCSRCCAASSLTRFVFS